MPPHQEQPRRLVISSMVLENFKSYAGAQRVGPFHKSFSSVVGPNGSGKSNVIDAMLFVFGRRAKQLRFNKVSELIHNSTHHRNLESARVTVYFEDIIDKDGDEYEVIPNSQFTVSRTANRNNTSDYFINDRRVPTKDVTDKLKGLGIDLDNNRFLILQGEVEQISMMRPKGEDKNDTGLLEYLEDIIGTDKYVQPIEEASKGLEEVNEKRQHMIQRLKVSEKDKDQWEGKKTEAEMFQAKQADMYKDRIYANTLHITGTQENLRKLEQKVTEFEAKLAYEREKFEAHDKEAKGAEKQLSAVDKEYKAIKKALEKAQEEFKNFERKDAKCQIELKNARTKAKKLAGKLESDAAQAQRLEAEVAAIEADAPHAKERQEETQQQLWKAEASLEGVLEGIKGEVEGYHQQLSQVRVELAPWEKRIGEVTGRISVVASERDVLAKKADDARRRLEAALKALSSAQQGAAHKQQQMADIQHATERCRQQIAAHKAELAQGQADEARLEGSVREARERAGALRADVNGSAQKSGLVVALMTAKAKGEVSGVYGRLGDLGAIDAKYDVAVSTAVGALDYIVVETTSDAQRCVEYLRKHNLGVATFLILEKQKHLAAAASQKLQTPEGVPRLYDLVKIKDDKLRPAFMYAMQNTLVADTLDQAARISYNSDRKFKRVVTLQGQLIAETGTMSGGGNRQSRGRMTLGSSAPRTGAAADAKAAAAELRKEEGRLEELTVALRSARDQITACTKALKAAERQLGELELAAPKADMEAKAEEAKAADIQQRLEELKAATQVDAADARRISELSQEISREEKGLAELRSQTQGLEARAAALQVKIDNAGGEKLKKAKAAVAKLEKDIADAEADAAKKAVQVTSHNKQVEKIKKERVKDEKERERMEGEVKRMEQEMADMEEQAGKVLTLVQATEEQLAAKQQELDKAQAEVNEIAARHGIIHKTEYEIEGALEQMARIHKEESGKVNRWQADIEALQQKYTELTGGDVVMVDMAELRMSAEDYVFEAANLEAELAAMSPDLTAIEEYRTRLEDYNNRAAELDKVTAERDELRRNYESLRKARLDEFMAGFNIISLKLKEMYQMITLGGDAELELVDSLDPFAEGIVFSVRPPKKSWKNISNLSGGEKTLSSLSLVFALHHYKPTPLYVMDEIDAALDFKNVSIVGHYIKDRTKNAQFIIISLRNNMFELADRLVGIYKTDNTTKTVAINPDQFVMPTVAAAQAPPAAGGKENNGDIAGPQPMAVA